MPKSEKMPKLQRLTSLSKARTANTKVVSSAARLSSHLLAAPPAVLKSCASDLTKRTELAYTCMSTSAKKHTHTNIHIFT